ncbi:MAG: hypothetical protein JST02_01175 [Bacteroidetes bacterium]|nr:hypothetical protein [Bacteroidota bacterium]
MGKTKLILFILAGLFLVNNSLYSQTGKDSTGAPKTDSLISKKQRSLNFGCGFGLNFIGGTNISLSPNLSYRFSDKFSAGVGIQGSYSSLKKIQSTITYGANIMAQFNPTKKIITTLEFTQLRVSTKTDSSNIKKNYWDSGLFAGIGYNITNKISVGVKYNFLYKEGKSIYTSPVIPFVNLNF